MSPPVTFVRLLFFSQLSGLIVLHSNFQWLSWDLKHPHPFKHTRSLSELYAWKLLIIKMPVMTSAPQSRKVPNSQYRKNWVSMWVAASIPQDAKQIACLKAPWNLKCKERRKVLKILLFRVPLKQIVLLYKAKSSAFMIRFTDCLYYRILGDMK